MKIDTGRAWAYTGTTVGVLCSLGANIAHAYVRPTAGDLPAGTPAPGTGTGLNYRPELIVIFGHAVWPVIFFIAVETAARNDWTGRRVWLVCLWVVGLVAAYLSWGHMYDVFRSWGWSTQESAVGPIGIDGLMILSAAALLGKRTTSADPVETDSPTESDSTDQSTDPRSTTDTAGAGEPETPPAPPAQDPDPIESTPRPPVESSIGSGTKAKPPATKKATAKPAPPPSADGTWPPAEAVHVAEWDQTRQVAWLARHKTAGRTVAELFAATAIPARTIERRLQKAANQTATPPQEDPATDGASDLQEVTS